MPIVELILAAGLLAITILVRILFAMLKASKKSNAERKQHYAKRNCDYSQDK